MIAVAKSAISAEDKQKYSHPIPNRDFIAGLLKDYNKPLSIPQLMNQLDLSCDAESKALKNRLRAMERDGQIDFNRRSKQYRLIQENDLVTGRVIGHREGFGFLARDDGGKDLFLSKSQMLKLFDKDQVQVRITGIDQRGREQASLVKVLERHTSQIVGQLYCHESNFYVIAENDRIAHEIDIDPQHLKGAESGQYVVVTLTDYPCDKYNAYGQITEILGNAHDPNIEIDVIMRELGIPHAWPKDVLGDANCLGHDVSKADKQQRVDLRALPFVTIDGDDAKDFDDAVYCEALSDGGWKLFVAIADVSHYVRPNSPLDKEAQTRGTSVYFPGRVVPMLPEALSNGLCSLNPNVDRLVMACEITIDNSGQMRDYCFSEAIIHSHARLTYSQVNAVLNKPDTKLGKNTIRQYANLVPHIHVLYQLYTALSKARSERGSIDFDTQEVQFKFDQKRKVNAIIPIQRNEAHMLIEECMLCANVATAQFLQKLKLPALYRNHKGPQTKKLESLRAYLAEKGLQLQGGDKPTPKDYDQLMASIKQRVDAGAIQSMVLRSLSQAEYSADNQGHFGLAYSSYAHFTSPIRRYPDLLVHRAIRSVIRSQESGGIIRRLFKTVTGVGMDPVQRLNTSWQSDAVNNYPYGKACMINFGEQCSQLSRRADKASWDVEAWLKCDYMRNAVGDTFKGKIASVTQFGLFIELDGTGIEGLLHISDLKNDYYQFNQDKQCLSGERSNKKYTIGDRISVKIVRVDMEQKKIEFSLAIPQPQNGM